MATQQLDLRPQQWFNQLFTWLINNEITNPTYNPHYTSKYFFLKKRKWIVSKLNLDWYDLLDFTEDGEYILTRKIDTWDYVVFDKEWNKQVTITWWWTADIFVKTLWWAWGIADNWTAESWDVTSLTDNDKSRTANELAWYYVYIKDWTWAWQLREILSNTDTKITVSWFDVAPWSDSVYKVYKDLWTNILVPYKNWCYIYDWTDWEDMPIMSWYNIKDMLVWNSRLWFVVNNKIIRSEEWDYYNIPLWNELFISDLDINNLFSNWNFLFVSTHDSIWLIYKWFSTNDWTPFFIIKEWVSKIWVKNRFWIYKYRNNVYVVWSDLRLYSIWVTMNWNEAAISLQDNWSLPASFINTYWEYNIRLYWDTNYLYLYTIVDNKTYEIYYNDLYKWWLNNEYNTIINKKKLLKSEEYVLWRWYYWVRNWYNDLWEDYSQKIKAIIWEQDIWMWKNLKYMILLLWKTDYIQNWKITFTSHIWNKKIIKTIDLWNAWYLTDMWDIVDTSTWWTVLWYAATWWDLSDIASTISDVDLIKIWLNITWQIWEVEINTEKWDYWIMFWWLYVYYNSLNPTLKYYKNIL